MKKIIVVFDGFCILCNKYVAWTSERNPSKNIYFTNFNSTFIKTEHPEITLGDTIFVITQENKILKKSAALKYCIKYLNINPIIKFIFLFSPNFLLDIFYRIIATNRYRLFGKLDVCSIPNDISKENILF